MYLKYSRISDYTENQLNNYISNIYLLKKNRILKSNNSNSKKRMIIGEILLSYLLKKYYNIDYRELSFNINKFGKPYIKDKNIYYNISHSFSYIICVISNNEIGIDIEKIRKPDLRTIDYFATINEKKYILCNEKKIEKRLFEIYTLKESYFKMLGTDMKKIKEIEFEKKGDKFICNDNSVKVSLNYNIDNYIIAICEKTKKD